MKSSSSSSWTFLTTTSLDQRNPSPVTPKQMKKTASRNKPNMKSSSSSSWTFLTTTSLDQRNPSPVTPKQMKKTVSRNKPIKVRYISNPMRVKTCASKFRELVQELTGQDAVDLEIEPEFPPSAVSYYSPSPPQPKNLAPRVLYQEPFDDLVAGHYEPLDGEEMFLSQMSGGFSGYFSNEFYNVNDYFGRIDSL